MHGLGIPVTQSLHSLVYFATNIITELLLEKDRFLTMLHLYLQGKLARKFIADFVCLYVICLCIIITSLNLKIIYYVLLCLSRSLYL